MAVIDPAFSAADWCRMDLFKPVVVAERFHPNFKRMLDPGYDGARKLFEQWAAGFVDRDGKFVQEFQVSFNSAFWEIYLYAVLKEMGKAVDFDYASPDFVVTSEPTFCMEAATAQAPEGGTPEWQTPLEDFWGSLHSLSRAPLVDQATVRLANTLTSKHRGYLERYSKLAHVQGKPFILAIAPFEQPFFYTQLNQAIMRTIFGFDYSRKDPATGQTIDQFMQSIKKPNGSPIPLAYFTNPGMAEISAVIFSSTATVGKLQALSMIEEGSITLVQTLRFNAASRGIRQEVREGRAHKESLFDGLSVFYNPYSAYAVPKALFNLPGVSHYTFDPKSGTLHCEIPDGALMQRIIATIRPKGTQLDSIWTLGQRKAWFLSKLALKQLRSRLSWGGRPKD
jgi:hypothetical protein